MTRFSNDFARNRVLMNIMQMPNKIIAVPDPVIGKSSLPYFRIAADDAAECMRIRALNQLHRTFYGYVTGGGEQEMNMIGHEDKRMQRIAALAPVVVNSFQEQSRVRFHNEEPAPLPCREGHKIGSGRRKESCRFQVKPQRLKPNILSKANSARVELVPFPVHFFSLFPVLEMTDRLDFLLKQPTLGAQG
jgi:hypothetical protein